MSSAFRPPEIGIGSRLKSKDRLPPVEGNRVIQGSTISCPFRRRLRHGQANPEGRRGAAQARSPEPFRAWAVGHAFGIRIEDHVQPMSTERAPSYLRPFAALRRAARAPILAPLHGHNNSALWVQSKDKPPRSASRHSD